MGPKDKNNLPEEEEVVEEAALMEQGVFGQLDVADPTKIVVERG